MERTTADERITQALRSGSATRQQLAASAGLDERTVLLALHRMETKRAIQRGTDDRYRLSRR